MLQAALWDEARARSVDVADGILHSIVFGLHDVGHHGVLAIFILEGALKLEVLEI